jgi:hypothetical protein
MRRSQATRNPTFSQARALHLPWVMTKRKAPGIRVALLLSVCLGCGGSALSRPANPDGPAPSQADASSAADAAPDADASPPDAIAAPEAPSDLPPEAPPRLLTGRHSFDVTATIPAGGTTVPVLVGMFATRNVVVPSQQTLTIVLDADLALAFITSGVYPVTIDGANVTVQGVFEQNDSVDEASVTYSGITFTIDGANLHGSARGTAPSPTDYEHSTAVDLGAITLTGCPDVTAPKFRGPPHQDFDPFLVYDFFANEALLPDSTLLVTGSAGDTAVYTPMFLSGPQAVAIFEHPKIILGYDETYTVDTKNLVDFAGHTAAAYSFKARAVPPLLADDGFESVPVGAFADATIIDDTAAFPPVIAGHRSLFIPANATTGRNAPECATATGATAAMRVTVPAGASTILVRSYGLTSADGFAPYGDVTFGTVGGAITQWSLLRTASSQIITLAAGDVYVGATVTTTILLPPALVSTAVPSFVVLRIAADVPACAPAGIPTGLVIDDVRAQ